MASIRKEGKYYKLYFYQSGKLRKISLKTGSKKVAEQIKRKIEDEIASGKFKLESYTRKEIRLEQFFEEAAKYSSNNKSPQTCQREKRIYKNFLSFCGDTELGKIKAKLIEAYKSYLLDERNFSPNGVNIELRHLSAAFSLAVKYEYLEKNPFKGVSKLKTPKKKPIFLTREQAKQLLDHTRNSELYQYIFIALNTGARISEVCNLSWKNIDFEHGVLKLFGKGSKERTLPLTNVLRELLENQKDNTDSAVAGSLSADAVSRQFRKAADFLGLHDFTFHNLRDTYASWLVQDGVNLKVIQELLGHESIQTTLIYAHLAPDSRFIAAQVIDRKLALVYGEKKVTD